jgi:hypothetical protein
MEGASNNTEKDEAARNYKWVGPMLQHPMLVVSCCWWSFIAVVLAVATSYATQRLLAGYKFGAPTLLLSAVETQTSILAHASNAITSA